MRQDEDKYRTSIAYTHTYQYTSNVSSRHKYHKNRVQSLYNLRISMYEMWEKKGTNIIHVKD